MLTTRITELLNIRYPILMGAMHHITMAEMVAAAANAGCIGFIPAASFAGPEDLRRELEKARGLTDGPIGLNISMLPGADAGALTDEFVRAGIEARVGAFETAGRSPEHLIGRIKQAKIPIIHKVPRVRHAVRAEAVGADAVIILGFEGGGFVGSGDVGSLVLVNRAVRSLSIPVIAGGGVADGRGLAAMLALGAEGVLTGDTVSGLPGGARRRPPETVDTRGYRERHDGPVQVHGDPGSIDTKRGGARGLVPRGRRRDNGTGPVILPERGSARMPPRPSPLMTCSFPWARTLG